MASDTPHFESDFIMRKASKNDLDDLIRSHIEGFTDEPQILFVLTIQQTIEANGCIIKQLVGHAVWNIAVKTLAKEAGIFKSLLVLTTF